MLHRLSCLALVAVTAALAVACGGATPSPRAIVILVSIDGFRWDYLEQFSPPTLLALASDGVRADGLIPQFPSKTFPNHYTIVTGLRLANHGIISNNMVAPDIPGRFSLRNRNVLADPRWWGGEPIWNTAERQGHRTSAMFWPGSEAPIGGRHATHWMPFDDDMPNGERVTKTLEWLGQPGDRQPSFLTLYFSDVDTAGHNGGPESAEVRDAVASVDASILQLVNGVRAAGLSDRVHYVIVSDHGMAELSRDRVIRLDDFIDISTVEVIDWSPVLGLSPKDGNPEPTYASLKDKHEALAVYRNAELPARFGLAGHPRLPAIVGIVDEGWHLASSREIERWDAADRNLGGNHGYDAQLKSMHGLFVASGPKLHRGLRVPAFESIHLYELMCALLGLRPASNDGDPTVTRGMLQ